MREAEEHQHRRAAQVCELDRLAGLIRELEVRDRARRLREQRALRAGAAAVAAALARSAIRAIADLVVMVY
jgi:hypothetical protein